ncbi:hypothetical protein HZS_5935 [Henneguya salminicola]|nr:hypothetical protein HZS_5935 [Henneguya salminicola]
MDKILKLSFIPKTLYTQMIQKYTLKPLRICGELLICFFENMELIVLPMNSNTWQNGKSKMYFPRSSILFDINTRFNNILYFLYLYSYMTSNFYCLNL